MVSANHASNNSAQETKLLKTVQSNLYILSSWSHSPAKCKNSIDMYENGKVSLPLICTKPVKLLDTWGLFKRKFGSQRLPFH